MRLPVEIAKSRRRANFDANEIGMPVNGPIGTLDSDEPWMRDHFTQENFEQLQEAQMGGELGPALDLTKQAAAPKTVMDLIRAKAMSYARDYFADHPEHLEDADGYAPDLAQAALFGFSSRDTAGVSKSVARDVAADAIVDYAESVSRGRPIRLANLEDACWEDYEAIGMKEKDGRMVPNCVPVRKARFHEGPEGKKEFEEWMDDQPEDFKEEWESNTDEYGDQFKKARFHEGPEGKKEFEDWMDDQPEDFKEEWESNTEEYGDQFKKAHRRNASWIDSNPYFDPKIKAAVMAFEEALDELIRKEGTLCRVASSSLNEILRKFVEEKRKFVMMGNPPEDFSDTPHGSRIIQAREYLEEITAACESLSSLEKLISFINSKA
jgi:hypothetical protein